MATEHQGRDLMPADRTWGHHCGNEASCHRRIGDVLPYEPIVVRIVSDLRRNILTANPPLWDDRLPRVTERSLFPPRASAVAGDIRLRSVVVAVDHAALVDSEALRVRREEIAVVAHINLSPERAIAPASLRTNERRSRVA